MVMQFVPFDIEVSVINFLRKNLVLVMDIFLTQKDLEEKIKDIISYESSVL